MKRLLLAVLALVVTLPVMGAGAAVASAARWRSAEKWAEFSEGGYTVRNNIWGEQPGAQTIWADSHAHFGVHATHPATSGIKSYPHAERAVHRRLSELGRCTSTFAAIVPASGAFNTAYDIWCERHAFEIMLWVNWHGAVGPIAEKWNDDGKPVPAFTDVKAGGHTWTVYKGTNGHNAVYSFLRTDQTDAGTMDVKDILLWVQRAGWFGDKDVLLDEVQFGWEITSSPQGLDFEVTDFSVAFD